jgi:TonB family protein
MQTWIFSAVLVLTVAIATVGCAGTNSNTPVAAATSPPAPARKVDLERTPAVTPEETRSSTSRPSAVSDGQAMQNWAMEVHSAIRKNWALSKELSPDNMCNLATTVRVRLLEDGTISEPRITKSSGNADFDEGCMNALSLTNRIPPAPMSPAGKVPRGIVLVFAGSDLASCGQQAVD